jgi:uncharacterized protein YjbI with pentapeptide repeats
MKINFQLYSKDLGINQTKFVEIDYHNSGYACSIILFGDSKNVEVAVHSSKMDIIPISRYLFVLDLFWSADEGFEFRQYIDPMLTSSLSGYLGQIRGSNRIKLSNSTNDNWIGITFKPEVTSADVKSERSLLESSKQHGLLIKDIIFNEGSLNDLDLSNLDLSECQFMDVHFQKCILNGTKFNSSRITNTRFSDSQLQDTTFSKAILFNISFLNSNMHRADFSECQVKYSPRRILDETILKINRCNLYQADFSRAEICLVLERSELIEVDFSQSKLVCCRFYDCLIEKTNFTGATFQSSAQGNKSREQYPDLMRLICRIGPSSDDPKQDDPSRQIKDCIFTSASMISIDLNRSRISNCVFEDVDLSNARLNDSTIDDCKFNRVTLEPAKCSFANFSFSTISNSHFDEVDFYRAIMIGVKDKGGSFISSKFHKANLRCSKFKSSKFTGAFLAESDLTLADFDECDLRSANFYQTQRGGLDLHIEPSKSVESDNTVKLTSTCIIKNVQWYSRNNGEVTIDEDTFLQIIYGTKSPIAVLANLTKENPNIINVLNQNQLSSESRSAGGDQTNADTNIESVSNSDVKGSTIINSDTENLDGHDIDDKISDIRNNEREDQTSESSQDRVDQLSDIRSNENDSEGGS